MADDVVRVAEHDNLWLASWVGDCEEVRGAYIRVDVSNWGSVDQDLDKSRRQELEVAMKSLSWPAVQNGASALRVISSARWILSGYVIYKRRPRRVRH